ncbi:MAG TPA: glycosyltransferase [Methylomirabilota bacterium]
MGAIADEPEAPEVFGQTVARRDGLPPRVRERVHLATIPAADPEEGAAMVNALQRRATVVLQKSRGEGFGMTVLEAMWKCRPVVCSRVGGHQEQMIDGTTGFLRDPGDVEGAAEATLTLLQDPQLCERMGIAGQDRVPRHFLLPREIADWAELFEGVLAGS